MKKDIAQKRLEEYNDIFAEIFNEIVAGGQLIVDEHRLTALPTEAVVPGGDGQLHEGRRDVCKADQEGNCYRLILALENQAGCDNTMPQRQMGYDFAAYEDQIRRIMKNCSHSIRHPREFLDLLATVSGKRRYREIEKLLSQSKENKGGITTMYDIEEEIFQEGVQEGIRKGIQKGLQQNLNRGIQALIEACRELGIPRQTTQEKVCEKYTLSSEEAETYVLRYW